MTDAVLTTVGGVVALATALPFIREGWWWVRVCDFPRLQLAVVGLATLAALLARGPETAGAWLLAAALAAAVAYQSYRILPYTPLYPTTVLETRNPDPERRLRLLIANVLMANRRSGDLLDLVRGTDPDLVLAVETDAFWIDRLAALDPCYPHRVKRPQSNCYGMLLLSKLELRDVRLRFLMDDDVPSIAARLVLRCGAEVDFYAVHPRPPRAFQSSSDRDAELLVVGREVRKRGQPVIVAGDLNDVAWSHVTRLFRRVSNLLDPRIGRGLYASFHARYPLLRWPLDHIFFSDEFRLIRLERMPSIGSDHFPMLAELSYEPEGADEQEARRMRSGDRRMMRRKIRAGGSQTWPEPRTGRGSAVEQGRLPAVSAKQTQAQGQVRRGSREGLGLSARIFQGGLPRLIPMPTADGASPAGGRGGRRSFWRCCWRRSAVRRPAPSRTTSPPSAWTAAPSSG